MAIMTTSGVSASTPTDQDRRENDPTQADRIERHVDRIMAAIAQPTASEQQAGLTPEQVCDMPMVELLAQVNATLDTTEINESGFFGYVTIHNSGRATIYLPSQASDLERDIATRYLITMHLGLPTDLFPGVLQATVIRDGEVQE